MKKDAEIKILIGQTMASVENRDNYEIVFSTIWGKEYKLYHDQDCCEHVSIEDICGDLNDLVGSPITLAEESTNRESPVPEGYSAEDNSFTWTFYRFATAKGLVTIRWYGSSNGYYSERVSFYETTISD